MGSETRRGIRLQDSWAREAAVASWLMYIRALLVMVALSCSGGGATTDGGVDATADTASDVVTPDALGDGGVSPCGTAGDRGYAPVETFPAALLIQNGGRVYDVQSPPTSAQRAAKGDGVTDDTAALQDAWDYIKNAYVAAGAYLAPGYDFDAANFWVYLPQGTYLVSDTIIYRGGTLETNPQGYVWNDVVNVRFVGDSRATTTIRLADGASGFGDVTMPKIVLALQHPDTVFNNIPTDNVVRNLTIDTGHGNPGAVALFFQGANLASMRDVTLTSGDGKGAYGLWFKAGSVQGYYRDITINGFADGIYVSENGEMNPALEHVTLTGQSDAAIHTTAGGLSVRAVCSDQRATGALGVKIESTGSQVVVLDSTFLGTAPTAMTLARSTEESLFVRGTTTPGYGSAVVRADAGGVATTMVDEWSALPTVTLFDGGAAHTLGLPIVDTPVSVWLDPTSDWADVDDFGAKGDGATDDTAAIQSAMSSGKPVVVFPKAAYKTTQAITVPATVTRIDGMWADLHDTSFTVSEASMTPISIEQVPGYGRITLAAQRPVISRERSGDFVDTQTAAVNVFLENAVNLGTTAQFCPSNQTTWARAIDTESASGTDFLVAGGTMWVFAYKTENKPCISLRAADGGSVEVFNGYVNTTSSPGKTPMVVNDQSTMSFIGFTNLSGNEWTTSIEEVRALGTQTVVPTALPTRDGTNAFVPLYSGVAR
jgi:Pectate lyase superfamily protein